MRRRRSLAALFALVALVLSVTETARASVCAEPVAASHEHHGIPGHAPDRAPGHNDSMPNCPLGLAWQAGCAPSASLPAESTCGIAGASRAEPIPVSDAVIPHGAHSSLIFHPPRS